MFFVTLQYINKNNMRIRLAKKIWHDHERKYPLFLVENAVTRICQLNTRGKTPRYILRARVLRYKDKILASDDSRFTEEKEYIRIFKSKNNNYGRQK